MAKLQPGIYNNARIDKLYIQERPTLQKKRALDAKSELYIHQPDLHKRITTLRKSSWSTYRHSKHYQDYLDPFYIPLKKWTPPRFFAYLSLKLTVHDLKIGHIYTANIKAHLAETYRCLPVEDSIKAQRKAKIKIMKVTPFLGQDHKKYLDVHAQYVSDEAEKQPDFLPNFHGNLVVNAIEDSQPTNVCNLYWPKPGDQISFIYCPKDRRKTCVINATWNLGDLHKKMHYSLPNEHFGNFISCRNPEFQIAYEAYIKPAYDDFIKMFKRKTLPERLDLEYTFGKHYYHRSGEYYGQQNDFIIHLRIRAWRFLCSDDKSEITVIGRICRSDWQSHEHNITPSEFESRRSTEDEEHLFIPGGLITITHYAKRHSSHSAYIAYILNPETNQVGAFPVIPV